MDWSSLKYIWYEDVLLLFNHITIRLLNQKHESCYNYWLDSDPVRVSHSEEGKGALATTTAAQHKALS